MASRTYRVALSVAAAAGAIVAAVLALSGRGTFEHRVLAIGVAVAGALLVLLASLLHVIARRAGRRSVRSVACVTAFFGVLLLSQIESWMIGIVIHERDLRAARAYAEQVVARLDHLRSTNGRYPPAIEDAVRDLPAPPYLFQRGGLFISSGDEFVLSFSEFDAVLPHVVQYSSASSGWARY